MDYQVEIAESVDYLRHLERATKDLKARDRVRFIRLLKIGQAATQKQAGGLIGLKVRQAQRLWKQYREEGLSRMGQTNYVGRVHNLAKPHRNNSGVGCRTMTLAHWSRHGFV